MKFAKLIALTLVLSVGVSSPVFNPRIVAELFKPAPGQAGDRGSLDPRCRFTLVSGASAAEEMVNEFSNAMIPSKEEVLKKVLGRYTDHAEPVSYAIVAAFKAYCLCPNKDNFGRVKAEDYKQCVLETGHKAVYNYAKDLLIERIRKHVDPYLKQGVNKTGLLNQVKNNKTAAVIAYVANRSVDCALDIGCDAAYNALVGTLFRK